MKKTAQTPNPMKMHGKGGLRQCLAMGTANLQTLDTNPLVEALSGNRTPNLVKGGYEDKIMQNNAMMGLSNTDMDTLNGGNQPYTMKSLKASGGAAPGSAAYTSQLGRQNDILGRLNQSMIQQKQTMQNNYVQDKANNPGQLIGARFAEGTPNLRQAAGIVRGAGGPTDDEVPMTVAGVDVNLSNGEAVLPAKTVQALGGEEAVEKLIHVTNGKPPVKGGLRAGGNYADGITIDGVARRIPTIEAPLPAVGGGAGMPPVPPSVPPSVPPAGAVPPGGGLPSVASGGGGGVPAVIQQPKMTPVPKPAAPRTGPGRLMRGAGALAAALGAKEAFTDDDSISVPGIHENADGESQLQGMPKAIGTVKELGLRAGDAATKGLDKLVNVGVDGLNSLGVKDNGKPIEKDVFNSFYRQGMRSVDGANVPLNAHERESTPKPSAGPMQQASYSNEGRGMAATPVTAANPRPVGMTLRNILDNNLGQGTSLPAGAQFIRDQGTPMVKFDTPEGMDVTKLPVKNGYGAISSSRTGKTTLVGPSEYVGADGKPTSDWSKTQAYADKIAQNAKDKENLAAMQRDRLTNDAFNPEIKDARVQADAQKALAHLNQREDAANARADKRAEIEANIGLRKAIMDQAQKQFDATHGLHRDEFDLKKATALAAADHAKIKQIEDLFSNDYADDKDKQTRWQDFYRTNFMSTKDKNGKPVKGLKDMSESDLLAKKAILQARFEVLNRARKSSLDGTTIGDITGGKVRPIEFSDVDWTSWGTPEFSEGGKRHMGLSEYFKRRFHPEYSGKIYVDPQGNRYRIGDVRGEAGSLGSADVDHLLGITK